MNAVVVGSANTDLIMQVDRLPAAGNTALGRDFISGPGGKGANQSVALARLGAETSLVARFGNDAFSAVLRERLESEGIDLTHASRDPDLSGGVVFIIVDARGDNTMVADLGSNLALSPEHVDRAAGLFDRADLLLLQLETNDRANLQACRAAQDRGVTVVLNPAPMRAFDLEVLRCTTLLTPNLHELSQLLDLIGGTGAVAHDETDPEKIGEAALRLLDYGPELVAVTTGSRGSIVAGTGGWRAFGTFVVEQVDSTAAGDAFTAGLAFCRAQGKEVEESVRFASACAAVAVSRPGAVGSLPRAGEVEKLLRESTPGPWGG